jgi:hypothetical protein
MKVGRTFAWVLLFLFVVDFLLMAAMHGYNEQSLYKYSKYNPDTMRLYYSRVEIVFNVINCPAAIVLYALDRFGVWLDSPVTWAVLIMAEAWLYSVLYVSWRRRRLRKTN